LADIDDAALKRHKREFEAGWNRLDRLPVDAMTIRRAGDLAEQYRLKAYDALHLATVDLMEVTLRSSVSFACFDDALNRAAARMGLALITGARISSHAWPRCQISREYSITARSLEK
jgi:predicted nucleic acid-binding protein